MRKYRVAERLRSGHRHGHKPGAGPSGEYATWVAMIARCENEKHRAYKEYGGRGIQVCRQWRGDFLAFLRNMGPKPSPAHSIERIDNDGDYTPDNCRWATAGEQANNRRSNQFIEFQGERLTLAQWSARTGIGRHAISTRLKMGWPVERALFTPPGPNWRGKKGGWRAIGDIAANVVRRLRD